MVHINHSFGHLTYAQRVGRKEVMRAQTGLYGDLRDAGDKTTADRINKKEMLWKQMRLPGNYSDAVEMGKVQSKANKFQSIMSLVYGGAQLFGEVWNFFKK